MGSVLRAAGQAAAGGEAARAPLELAMFGLAAVGLAAAGAVPLAIIFGIVVVLNATLPRCPPAGGVIVPDFDKLFEFRLYRARKVD